VLRLNKDFVLIGNTNMKIMIEEKTEETLKFTEVCFHIVAFWLKNKKPPIGLTLTWIEIDYKYLKKLILRVKKFFFNFPSLVSTSENSKQFFAWVG